MYKVKVFVTLRESVLDPQGSAVQHALHSMNYKEVSDVRIGKYMELAIEKRSVTWMRRSAKCVKSFWPTR